ncbi:MAG: hypothetical protein Q4A32_07635 [Lachnospiraceae bacterium]|nr:hypothetical protein [Lachnospiraceae bacterium]
MRRLIRADLKRLTKKKILWIFLAVSYIVTIGLVIGVSRVGTLDGNALMTTLKNTTILQLLVGTAILLSVYGDEFRSMALTTLIGRGFSRTKIIIAKFLDAMILVAFVYLIYYIGLSLIILVSRVGMTPFERWTLISSAICGAYSMFGHIIIASFFLFLTGNVTISVFVYVFLETVVPAVTMFVKSNAFIAKFHLDRFNFEGLGRMAFTDFLLGQNGGAVFKLVLGLVLFAGVFLAATAIYFGRKELDF